MHIKNMLYSLIITLNLLLLSNEVFARAGGGGYSGRSGSSGGWKEGLFSILFDLAFFLLLSIVKLIHKTIFSYWLNKKNKESQEVMEKIAEQESTWRNVFIKKQIREVFFKVQEAWMERNQDIEKVYMSQSLYEKHKLQTDEMLKKGHKNILKKIKLIESRIVEVTDCKDNSKDKFWVYIKGSMIDYTIDEKTDKIISGDKSKNEKFSEFWKFIRGLDNNWILDEIKQKDSIRNLYKFKSSTCLI